MQIGIGQNTQANLKDMKFDPDRINSDRKIQISFHLRFAIYQHYHTTMLFHPDLHSHLNSIDKSMEFTAHSSH